MDREETFFEGKWLSLRAMHSTNGEHSVRWEFSSHVGSGPSPKSVIVLAIAYPTDEVILIANFRYAVNQFVIELPSGYIDADEDLIEAALREVKEETGYTASPQDVIGSSPMLYAAPWVTSGLTTLITMRIDLSLPENQVPKQKLEEVENIKVLMLPKRSLLSSLLAYANQEGYGINSSLYILAQGLELSSALS